MSSGYNERKELPAAVEDLHRALASLQEELEAVDYYNQRAAVTGDADLKAVLEHNRNEEVEHASMLLEWLRRRAPQFDAALKTYLFSQAPITAIEQAGGGGAAAEGRGDLGIGKNA